MKNSVEVEAAISIEDTLRLALEALEKERPYLGAMPTLTAKAIAAIKAVLSAHKALMSFQDGAQPSEASEQRSVSDVEPVANVVLREGSPTLLRESDIKPTDERLYTTQPVLASDISQERVDETQKQRHDITPYVATPLPQRKPQFKEFIKWAGAQGYDCAQTCNSDTGEWIVLNPVTADLWKAWQAAHGITDKDEL